MTATLIKAAEIWTPDTTGTLLEFHAGAYGAARRMAHASRAMCFGRGEGLPGHAWDSGQPTLLPSFEGSYFRRTAAAHEAGLTCAIALPYVAADKLTAVLILYCGHHAAQPGALELWSYDSTVSADMKLSGGAYGPGGTTFEAASHSIVLSRGVGLPGTAWQTGLPVIIEELTTDPTLFLRAAHAARQGLQRGLAIPVAATPASGHVVTFLAGPQLPLAHRIERWAPDESRQMLKRIFAFSELHGGRSALEPELSLTPATGGQASTIVSAWNSGIPEINEHVDDESGSPGRAACSMGAIALLAIPIRRNGRAVEVLALYL